MLISHFKRLSNGDIVRHKISKRVYTVMANYGERVTAVDTVDITNPDEWEVVSRARVVYGTKLHSNIMYEIMRQVGDDENKPIAEARQDMVELSDKIIDYMLENNIDPDIEDFDEMIAGALVIVQGPKWEAKKKELLSEALIITIGDLMYNSQGNNNSQRIRELIKSALDEGKTLLDLENELKTVSWEHPMITEGERIEMKRVWESYAKEFK